MKFAQRDFSAILKLGIQLISDSDNPQNAAAARKLIYGLARFVSEDRIQSVQTMADLIDFEVLKKLPPLREGALVTILAEDYFI